MLAHRAAEIVLSSSRLRRSSPQFAAFSPAQGPDIPNLSDA